MRRTIIAGNWKMNKTVPEALDFLERIKGTVADRPDIDVILCPPFTALYPLSQHKGGYAVNLAGQNLFWKKQGAYTGQISAPMLTDAGAAFVIIGHSETRGRFGVPEPDFTPEILAYFHDTDETVNRKAHEAVEHGLVPIICVGETLVERDANSQDIVVADQVIAALKGFSDEEAKDLVIAYEPVWAIGTGRVCDVPEANRMCIVIRNTVKALYNSSEVSDAIRIQYGGSAKPENAGELLCADNIDGLLVGGASLKYTDFSAIIQAKPKPQG